MKSSKKRKYKQSSFKVGRPNSLDFEKKEELLKLYYSKPISLRNLAKMFGVSRMTVWRTVNEVPGAST